MADGHVATFAAKDVVNADPGPEQGQAIWPPIEVLWRPDPLDNPNHEP
jgi:hypothetical protein